MANTKYTRDFEDSEALVRRNEVVPEIFQHVVATDSYDGLQKMIHALIAAYGPRQVIEGFVHGGTLPSSVTLTEGWAMRDGVVIHLDVQTGLAPTTGQFIYLITSTTPGDTKFDGELAYAAYSVESIAACTGVPLLWNNGGTLTDIRPLKTAFTEKVLGDVIITNNLTAEGNANIDGNCTIGGKLIGGLPIGAMIVYDANNPGGGSGGASGVWVDNSTLPGWYACVSGNSVWGCPNMQDKFLLGKVATGAGVANGGSNSLALIEANLPAHTHTINHTHGEFTASSENAHTHYLSVYGVSADGGGSHAHIIPIWVHQNDVSSNYTKLLFSNYSAGRSLTSGGQDGQFATTNLSTTREIWRTETIGIGHTHATTSTGTSGAGSSHTHTVNVTAYSGSSGSIGSATAMNLLNTLATYTAIWIRRCV